MTLKMFLPKPSVDGSLMNGRIILINIMYNSILLGIKQQQYNRYSEAFNFFQSKSINNIIRSQKVEYVINYRDLEILDDETQYFKRYYSTKQTSSRIQKLINYYELNMTPPSPCLILINTFSILQNRKKKHIKLIIMREKSLARRAEEKEQEQDHQSQNMILWELNQSNFSEASSEKEENQDPDEYDDEPFYAFQQGEEELRITGNSKIKEVNLINLKDIAQSDLIVDFKAVIEEPPKINIKPPINKPPSSPPVEKISRQVQTLPMEVPHQRRQEKMNEMVRGVPIPQLKKQKDMSITPISQIGLGSVMKKENVMLTESIEMAHRKEEKEKTKTSTFMEYYNSQPVKSPSNILEKYIKRKK